MFYRHEFTPQSDQLRVIIARAGPDQMPDFLEYF
jgi:hypothetical protein